MRRFSIPYLLLLFIFFIPLIPLSSSQDVKRGNQNPGHPKQIRNQLNPPRVVVDPQQFEIELDVGDHRETSFNIENQNDHALEWEIQLEVIENQLRDNTPLRDDPGDYLEEIEAGVENTSGLAWDGRLMWGCDFISNVLRAYNPVEAEVVVNTGTRDQPLAMTFDGERILVSNYPQNLILSYDLDGNLVDEIEIEYNEIQGLAHDKARLLFVNTGVDNLIHVFNNDMEEIAEIDYHESMDNQEVWSIVWVPEHPDGQLWGLSEGRAFQVSVNENWEVETVQDFRINSDHDFVGIAHDGSNMWHGSWETDRWYVFDDGVDEGYWISFNPQSGALEANSNTDVQLALNAELLFGGEYQAVLHVLSDDEDNPEIEVEVSLIVTGIPEFVIEWEIGWEDNYIDWNDYHQVYSHGVYPVEVTFRNIGTDILSIEEIYSESDAFRPSVQNLELDPHQSAEIDFIFTPDTVGEYSGEMIIISNDPDHEEGIINLRGQAQEPPGIVIEPLEIEDRLLTGQSSEHSINIFNDGEAPLQWELQIEIVTEPDRDFNTRNLRHSPGRDEPGEVLYEIEIPYGVNQYKNLGYDADNNWMWLQQYAPPRVITAYNLNGFDPAENEVPEIAVSWESVATFPMDMAVNDGIIYVMELWNEYLGRFDLEGNRLENLDLDLNGDDAVGVAIDPIHNRLFVAGNAGEQILCVFDLDGERIAEIGSIRPIIGNQWWRIIDWVSDHQDGQFWVNSGGSLSQLKVDTANWEFVGNEPVSSFDTHSTQPYDGFAHDGANFWVSSYADNLICVYDDGILESDWILSDQYQGELNENEETDIIITMDATSLIGGNYEACLHFMSNDPDDEDVEVVVNMDVTGAPDLQLSWAHGCENNEIDWSNYFEEIFASGEYPVDITFRNNGTEDLIIESISCENEYFNPDIDEFVIEPIERQDVQFIFAPRETGNFNSTMVIICNDPDTEEIEIALSGQSFAPPEVIVEPMEIEDFLITGESAEHIINIRNRGEAVLQWEIEIDFTGQPEQDLSHRNLRFVYQTSGKNGEHQLPSRDNPGDIIASYEVPYDYTTGLQWDGELMWGLAFSQDRLYALDPIDGEIVHDFQIHDRPANITFDGMNFWIGAVWNERVYIYDRNGDQIDEFSLITFDGIACDQTQYIFLNGNDRRIHVFDMETHQEIVDFAFLHLCDNHDVDCIEWVPQHPNGQLWCLVDNYAYQIHVNDNWQAEAVQNFRWNADEEFVGISHDGENLWHGMRNERNWYVHDDGAPESNWLVIDPTSGELARNQETDVTLTLNADFCVNGVYEADVNIFTNDPDDELITVHVTLEVEGAPDIRVGWHIVTEENTINWNDYFDPLYNHGEYGVEIWIRNTGTDVLHINNIHCENNAFIAAPVRFNLGVNETESVSFIFRPNNAGDYENVMVISSDDPNQPEYEINLRAHAFAPPMIIITPLEIEDMLMTGEQSEFAINVSNDGEADLQWRTTMEIISEPGRDDNTRTLRGADDILRRDDPGDVVGSYDVPMENTSGLQWIDNRMWGFFIGSNRMYALDPDNREIEEMFQIPDDPTGFAFDGRNIWMGQSWDNVAYEYDRNGNLLDRHQMINFDGISCVEDDFLLLNSQNDNLIHVYDMDNLERVAEIQFINLCDNGDIDCIEWVPSHPDGQLWCLATGHVYQLYINDDWQAELVQHIQLNVDDEWCGLGHDGTNLWHGMENERRWYALDDGVEESRWISYDPKEGELSREEDTNIFVLLDATGCLGGMYEAGIYFFSNDPECEEMEVTITLEVEGAPDIDTDWKIGADENTINWNEYFIEVFNNGIYEIPVEILNVGTDVLEVDDIVCNNRLFTSEPIDFVLDPRTSQDVIFIFSPEESGEYHEVMSIFSNDHDEEEVQIQLVAQSFSPPIIIINPLEIEDMLVTGETSEHSVNISNEGEANLRWSSTLEIISEPGRDENARSLRSVGSPMRRDDPGDVLAQYEVPFLNTSGLQWVDGLMWGTSTNSNLMIGLDPETQEFVEELQIINSPTGLSFDGTNFWIGQSWNNVAFVYDRNGNLVDSHVMINFDGITCIEDDFLLLNSQEDNLIHVFDRENLNEIARINYLNLCDQRDIDCIEWVSDHPEGQLWCMGTGRVFQLYVNENWEPEFVQQFAWNADDEWCGIAHDGENLWHGMEDERIWYVYDDGVIETRWITFEPKSGELEREQDVNIFVNLDATGCLGGMYEAGIHILSNDPDDEEIEICITLEVEGAPDIDADWEIGADENIINWNEYYDEVFVNGEYDIIVEVINAGTDVLEIDDIDCDNELFSVEPADFVLDPRTSRDVILTFAPVESDEYNETMTIYSNDHDEAEFEISLVAHSFNPPIIAVTPLEIDDSLYTGDEAEHSFNIYNEGEALLRWETDIEIINEPGRDENIRSLRSAGSPVRRDDPGDILAEYEVPIRSHTGLAWDGELVWGISYEEGRLVALDPDNGEVVVNNRIHNEPLAMAFDGELLWIGHFEDNTIQRYDLNGEQVDNIQVNYWWIYGLTFDNNGHLLLNAGDDGRIHVYNIENMQEITEFAHRQAMGNRDIWGIAWVDEHEGGQLWGETENRMYQTNVDDDWNVEAVQNFACNNVYYYAICHDGEDFWCGGNWDDNRWYVFDDGIIETRWIVNEPENGELEYDDDINVNVYLNAEGCIGGHYEARIHVLSNDPEREEIDVTVTLDVEGAPDMVVDWEIGVDENIINWNEYYLDVFTNGVYVVPVTINNIGTDPLEVNDIRCENDVFHAEPTEFSVAIDESQEVVFSFAPEESEEYDEIMTIYCDDPDNEEFEIQLLAVSAAPPEIVIRPHLIEDRLIAGVYEEYEIGIYNYGEALLRWSSSIEIISEPERDQNNRILRSVYHSPQRDSAGDIVAEYEVPFENTSGLQWVGGLMWGITRGSDHIFSLDPENGDIVEEFQIHEDPTCLSFDGINFWIGQSWGNNAYEYDRDGNLVDVHGMMITIDGITCIEDEFLLLNSQEDNLIHVFDRENLNEIARINYLNLCNNRDIDCIEWVSDHPDGQLWCMGTGRVFQLYVNENWEPEFAQQFVWNADDEWCGIAHDGENLWHGMEDERMWYVYDDGVEELRWLELNIETGEVECDDSMEIIISINLEDCIEGAYEAAVIISSNDPVNPEVEISVLIDVDGLPAILTYPTAYPFEGAQDIEFPNTYVEQENDPVEITIHNLGLGVLEFQNVELTNSDDFSTNAVADISIESHDSTVFEVSFNPAERGFKECTLNFYTNAENIGGGEERGHVWFNLTGTGVVHPVIETDPEDDECIDVTLPPDGIPVEKDLIIRNAAGDYGLDLAFRIRAVNIEEDDRDSDEDFRNLRNSNSNPRRDDPGEILASYNVPFTHTYGMCFDGERIWGVSTSENRLFALNPVNEEIVRSYNLNFSPYSLTFDGEHLWISDHFGNIYLFNLEGNLIETVHTELGYIWGLAYDWNGHVLANAYSRRLIYVISVENYREIASFGIMDRLENIDNRALHCCMEWVPDHIDGSLWILIGEWLTQHFYAMQLSVDDDWAVEEVSRFEFEVPGFIGICHDGKNLWHGGDYRDHTWYVYDEGIFENIVEWLTIEPQAGLIETGDEREIILTFNSEDLEEDQDYFAELQIKSNDPVTREILIDIHLNTSRIEPRELGVFLAQDWNMISINVIPDREFWLRDEGPDIVLMTEQLRIDEDNHHVIILKDSNGEFYMPVYGFNGIPYWNLEQGYMVKVDEDIETTWTGAPIEFDADIHIEQGWNIIPYYPTWELDASADEYYVLSSIIDHVLLAKDVNGDFIAPEYGHSSMQPWRETQGYQINVDEDVTLNYPEAREERSLISKNRSEGGDRIEVTEIRTPNKHWNKPANTGCNMSLLINISNNYQLAEGDQLAAITADGKIAGVGIFNDNRCGLAVWGDDPTTDYIDGLKDGEAYTLKIWDQSRNEALDVEIVNVMKGDGLKYRNDGFTVLSAEITPSAAIPDDYYLSQNYPNPFNETTKLEFGLPQDTRISIAVYDLSGRLVKCLINSDYRAGHYTTIWQADDVVAGIYIVRISATDFTSVKKMILIK